MAAAKLSTSDFLKLRNGLKLLKLEDALEKASCRKKTFGKVALHSFGASGGRKQKEGFETREQ